MYIPCYLLVELSIARVVAVVILKMLLELGWNVQAVLSRSGVM